MPPRRDLLLYLDLETTGNEDADEIIEVGAVMLDAQTLKELGDFSEMAFPSKDALKRLLDNDVVREMHFKSGLSADLSGCTQKLSEVEEKFIAWMKTFTGNNSSHIMWGGSGVLHFDAKYLNRDMPKVMKRLTYFALDVGVVRRTFQLFGAETMPYVDATDKKHRALDDARLHADELRFYRKQLSKIRSDSNG